MVILKTNRFYEAERNKLIPIAEEYADLFVGPKPREDMKELEKWNALWNLAFHLKMEELAKGLRK